MGLDMYLTKHIYLAKDQRRKLKISGVEGIRAGMVWEIIQDAGYWRKANAIHNWFVSNVQNGEDDCEKYNVDEEAMKKLLVLVERVLTNHDLAEQLLPTQEGFFFGSTEYDEYYFNDLKATKKILEAALKDAGSYHYQSDW